MAQNQCIFEYCNFGKGYLRLYFPARKNVPAKETIIELEDYSVVEGVIGNIEPLVDRIKFEMNNLDISSISSPLLLLRCVKTYRNSIMIPVKSSWQAKSLYNKEMKAKGNKDLFYTTNNSYKSGAGYIFNTYYMEKDIVESFIKIAKGLGTDISEVQPYGMYLAQSLEYNNNYVFFHIRRKVCTMILVYEDELITSYDFEFESPQDIMTKFLLVASKHEFELEKKPITHYGISADEPVNFRLPLKKLGEADEETDDSKTELEQALAESVRQSNDQLEVAWENYDNDKTIFSKRYADSADTVRNRYDAISKLLLSYMGMKCRVTEQFSTFHINSEVYAKMDIRENRVLLYLPINPEKYITTRYPCALTKRRGFEDTPCLYRIATTFRQDGAFIIIADLVAEKGLVPKPQD